MNDENVNNVTICLNKDLLKNYDLMEEIKAEIIKNSKLTNDTTLTNDDINIKNWIFLDKEEYQKEINDALKNESIFSKENKNTFSKENKTLNDKGENNYENTD